MRQRKLPRWIRSGIGAARAETSSHEPFKQDFERIVVSLGGVSPRVTNEMARLRHAIQARLKDRKRVDVTAAIYELGPAMERLALASLKYQSGEGGISARLGWRGVGSTGFDSIARTRMNEAVKAIRKLEQVLFRPERAVYTKLLADEGLQGAPPIFREYGSFRFTPFPPGFTLELLQKGLAAIRERAVIRELQASAPGAPGKPDHRILRQEVQEALRPDGGWLSVDPETGERVQISPKRNDCTRYSAAVMEAIEGKPSKARTSTAGLRRRRRANAKTPKKK